MRSQCSVCVHVAAGIFADASDRRISAEVVGSSDRRRGPHWLRNGSTVYDNSTRAQPLVASGTRRTDRLRVKF